METITVKKLYQLCIDEIINGNSDKKILISKDDEGNGYHELFYAFTHPKEIIDVDDLNMITYKDDAKLDDYLILG